MLALVAAAHLGLRLARLERLASRALDGAADIAAGLAVAGTGVLVAFTA
jgi:hypothetical protein